MRLPARAPDALIHAAGVASAGVGAGLAQLPGSDAPVLVSIQSAMILALADWYGVSMTQAAATQLLLTFTATMAGRGVSQWAIGWVPGWGNAVNATTAAALTEAVGWAAKRHFEGLRGA